MYTMPLFTNIYYLFFMNSLSFKFKVSVIIAHEIEHRHMSLVSRTMK